MFKVTVCTTCLLFSNLSHDIVLVLPRKPFSKRCRQKSTKKTRSFFTFSKLENHRDLSALMKDTGASASVRASLI